MSLVTDWIDTGSYALNAIISGSVYGGIPVGRITGLVGPQSCGKTLIISKTFAAAQKKGMIPVMWDTEFAFDRNVAAALGCDPDRIKTYPVESIEDCKNQISVFLDRVIEEKLEGKFIIGLDSLGNMASKKELNDAAEGKTSGDMGLRAKVIKSMMRTLTYKCARAKCPMIFSNHVYDNPGQMFPTLVKDQTGGKGPLYLSSVLVQFGVRAEKKEDDADTKTFVPIANKVSGVTLRALTTKNRFVPPFLEVELYVNFRTGIDKYSGLVDMLKAFNLIKEIKSGIWALGEQKLGRVSEWKDDPKIWDTILLPKLDEVLKKELTYSNTKFEALKDEVETL